MNIVDIPCEIQDNRPKISVGLVIRKVTTYLNEEVLRVIKELAPMNNIENKRNTLQILIREFHNAIKKLQKFLKNTQNFKKISKLDKLSAIMFTFNQRVVEAVDQLYYTHEMCKFYRTPNFNMEEAAKVINFSAYQGLKKTISTALNNLAIRENKETLFGFLEKFFYGENLNSKDKLQAMEKMKRESLFELNMSNNLLKLQNLESREFVSYKNDQLIFHFGEVIFKIMLFSYQVEEANYFTYFCSEISLSNNQKYFSKTTDYMRKYLQYLNNDIIYADLQIPMGEITEHHKPSEIDVKFSELQNLLRNFTSKHIYSNIFKQVKLFLRDYIKRKVKLPLKMTTPSQNEIKMSLDFEIKTQDFNMEIKMDQGEDINHFKFMYSHSVINHSPLIFTKNGVTQVYFNQLGKLNIEKLICQKISEFEKIHLFLLYETCKMVKSIYIPFKVIISESNYKISYFYHGKHLLFSIFNDQKGGLQITDENFIFKSNKENSLIIKDFFYSFLIQKHPQKELVLKLNQFIFKNFLHMHFSMFNINMSFDTFTENKLVLKFLIMENKNANKKIFLYVDMNIEANNKMHYSDLTCQLMNKNEEVLFSFPIDDSISLSQLKTYKNAYQKLDLEIFNKMVNLVRYIETHYEDFFKNLIECSNYFNSQMTNDENLKLIINVNENLQSFEGFIEKDNLDLIGQLFKEIQIYPKNLIFKIILDETNLKSKFNFSMTSFSIFDSDNIIHYSKSECSLGFYFLTKMTKNNIDFWYHRRFFLKICNKVLNFIKKLINIINKNEMRAILESSTNLLISPVGMQFTHNFFSNVERTIILQFANFGFSGKKNMKCLVLPLEYHQHSLYFFDMLIKLLQDSDENTFLPQLKNLIFFSLIYTKISKKFSSYIFPLSANTYDLINGNNKIFVFIKDSKTFHIIRQNKLSIFLEVVNPNQVNIFSSYLWNADNCTRFMDSIVSNNEIQSKTNHSNSFAGGNLRKMIVLNNDTQSLVNDIYKILEHLETF